MDSNEQLVEQIVKFRGSSEITCPHIAGVMLRQDCSRCWAEFIRSYTDALTAAAVEECAKAACNEAEYYMSHPNSVDWDKRVALIRSQQSQRIAELIKQKTPAHARRALELREVKARLEEAKDYTTIVRAMVESPRAHKRCLRECESHLADLERRREELEEEKHV